MELSAITAAVQAVTRLSDDGALGYSEIQLALMIRGTVYSMGVTRINKISDKDLPELYVRLTNLRNTIKLSLDERNKHG